ncbi:MAG: hypothetical protein V2A63_03825 [Patescibacteria group bacterium]
MNEISPEAFNKRVVEAVRQQVAEALEPLQAENAQLKAALAASDQVLLDAAQQVKRLISELEAARAMLAEQGLSQKIQAEMSSLRAQLAEAQAEIKNLQGVLAIKDSEHQEEIETAQKLIDELEQRLNTLQSQADKKIADLKKQIAELLLQLKELTENKENKPEPEEVTNGKSADKQNFANLLERALSAEERQERVSIMMGAANILKGLAADPEIDKLTDQFKQTCQTLGFNPGFFGIN